MLLELEQSYSVHTFVAVLKLANYRSMGLLRHLGFEVGNQEDAQRYEAEQDETVMLKASGLVTPRCRPGA
jgi:L-amino acid N-acyltransferase YncA